MRHRMATKTLGRNTSQRKSLLKNLATELVMHNAITTTEAKAKVVRGVVDKMVHKAQEGTVSARRVLAAFFAKREVVNRLVDEVAPAMKDRASGFTRLTRLGNRRGDDTMMVKMEFVHKPVQKEEVKVASKTKQAASVKKVTTSEPEKASVKKAVPAPKKAKKEVK